MNSNTAVTPDATVTALRARVAALENALEYTVATLDNILPVIVSELGDDDGECEEVTEELVTIRALLAETTRTPNVAGDPS